MTARKAKCDGFLIAYCSELIFFNAALQSHSNPSLAGEGRIRILPGQVFDSETGLFQNHHREYQGLGGRYLTSDPIGLEGGSLSLYTYVSSHPLKYTDPKGLQSPAACALNPANAAACAEAGMLARPAPQAICPPEKKNCTMASKWQLGAAGITDEHDFKEGWVGKKKGSRYDICACDDGSITIRGRGQCGSSGATIDTDIKWK